MNLFENDTILSEFKEYSLQDSICLLNALNEAQQIYLQEYRVDITSILSTSTLSLKIFRKIFLKDNIPILSGWDDKFIRESYFGGATDYYKGYGKNLYYYDVNSLYPKAMCNLMPFQIIKKHESMNNINLDNFFGFCLAEIETPKDIMIPLLPYKYQGKTIFPRGK